MASSTCEGVTPRTIPNLELVSVLRYTGVAPQSISAFITLLWTFRGTMISSPARHTESTIFCTA